MPPFCVTADGMMKGQRSPSLAIHQHCALGLSGPQFPPCSQSVSSDEASGPLVSWGHLQGMGPLSSAERSLARGPGTASKAISQQRDRISLSPNIFPTG